MRYPTVFMNIVYTLISAVRQQRDIGVDTPNGALKQGKIMFPALAELYC
jgi:hypothetical protein